MLVLYNPRSDPRYRRLPLSLLALGAVLEGRYAYQVVDGNVDPDPVGRMLAARPDAVGVTVMPGPQLRQAVQDCRALRQRRPDLPILWGGYFPSEHPEVCLTSGLVDVVALGHAEATLPPLLDDLAAGRRPGGDLLGLALMEDGRPRRGALPPLPDPDALPRLPYHRVRLADHVSPSRIGRRTLNHHSSYGCPFQCNFCSVAHLSRARWRPESAARVVETVRSLAHEAAIDSLEFHDNNFFTSEARVREIAEGLAPLGLAWWGEGRVDTLLQYDELTWRAMAASGCRMVFMGAESGSAEALARMDKGGSLRPEMAEALAARCAQWGIVPEFSFVLGCPPDPEQDLALTFELVRRVKQRNPRAEIILYLYTPVPMPGLFDAAVAAGFRYPETLDEWAFGSWSDFSLRRHPRTPWLQERQRRLVRDFEAVLHARYPSVSATRLSRAWRAVLPFAAGLRYRLRLYDEPLELRLLLRLARYWDPARRGPVAASAPAGVGPERCVAGIAL
ncbi:MAG: B12-binding domain-containing radical SAM protein [Chloroflexi bacterium]|nr:B12-binding domain-containing radical SAM protein [Chloroflexota bacterium]